MNITIKYIYFTKYYHDSKSSSSNINNIDILEQIDKLS